MPDKELPPSEVEARMERALIRSLNTPPQPRDKPKKKRASKKARSPKTRPAS